MSTPPDRLYDLLPDVYRQRDEEYGQPLRGLLRVIGEQVDVVEEDIEQLYENWFIETCQDWVVPYLGDLIGYRPVHEAGEPGDVSTIRGMQRNKILIPRREVANAIGYRRRKGTLALLELLASDVSDWPARAVEFYGLLGLAQAINHLRPARGRSVDLRMGDALDRLDGPFDEIAHSIDVRRVAAHRTRGRYNIPSVGLFVWRLNSYPITGAPAYRREEDGNHCFTFSALGNDIPLYARPLPESEPTDIADEPNLPVPIRRLALQTRKTGYYGQGKSLRIWVEGWGEHARQPVPPERILPADLDGWYYRPRSEQVAVDPERGRIAFHPRNVPSKVWVSYHYGFSAELGGGEYHRSLSQPERALFDEYDLKDLASLARKLRHPEDPVSLYLRGQLSEKARRELEDRSETLGKTLIDELNRILWGGGLYDEERFEGIELSEETLRLIWGDPQGWDLVLLNRLLLEQAYPGEIARGFALYRVERGEGDEPINEALRLWEEDKPRHAIIEITDNEEYAEQIDVVLDEGQTLQLRAADRRRPVIRFLDWHASQLDSMSVRGGRDSRFTLDGLLIAGRGIRVGGALSSVTIRHCTLVPGWTLRHDCEPGRPAEPSLQLLDTPNVCVNVEHSILGSIQLDEDEVRADPVRVRISDSILDATGPEREALGTPDCLVAHARLTIARSTVIGHVGVHAIDLAENSIFSGHILVGRRQWGCVRFCYVTPGSRTPRRYNCQPDLVEEAARAAPDNGRLAALERERVRPLFDSTRYGIPTYCQLSEACAEEIKRGSDDESEMGVFHDLFRPQREANLRARLDEYTPAGTDAGIIFAS